MFLKWTWNKVQVSFILLFSSLADVNPSPCVYHVLTVANATRAHKAFWRVETLFIQGRNLVPSRPAIGWWGLFTFRQPIAGLLGIVQGFYLIRIKFLHVKMPYGFFSKWGIKFCELFGPTFCGPLIWVPWLQIRFKSFQDECFKCCPVFFNPQIWCVNRHRFR